MELLTLKRVYCSGTYRNDLSATISNLVAVVVNEFPKDTVTLGRVFPHDIHLSADPNKVWWLLGYSLKFHMVFAQPVTSTKGISHIMTINSYLRAVDGAKCRFNAHTWGAEVVTDKLFYELDTSKLSDEAIVASFLALPPERFSIELGYTQFNLNTKDKEVELPFVSEWVELDIPYGLQKLIIPEGVKHLTITSSLSEALICLPDTIVSCHISRRAPARLSIPKKFAKYWGYWSAVWGNSYKVPEGFKVTPDGAVVVRD